jgi:hypothetical protein
MKWMLIVLSVLSLPFGLSRPSYGQGTLRFNNLGPKDGRVILFNPFSQTLLNQDLNFSLEVQVLDAVKIERSWLLSDGTAKGINVGPGLFADPTGSIIVLPDFVAGASINVIVGAWAGDYPTYSDAAAAGVPAGTSMPFSIRLGSVDSSPAGLGESFRGFGVGVIPEPGIITLAIFGMAFFAFDRSRRRSKAKAS